MNATAFNAIRRGGETEERKALYFVLDVDAALRRVENPVKVLLLTETDCREMVDYYGGEIEAYSTYREAQAAAAWYRRN